MKKVKIEVNFIMFLITKKFIMFLRQTLIKYQKPISLDIGTKIIKVTKSSSKKYSFFSSDFKNNFFKIRNYFKKLK